jgi:hypothetical protein
VEFLIRIYWVAQPQAFTTSPARSSMNSFLHTSVFIILLVKLHCQCLTFRHNPQPLCRIFFHSDIPPFFYLGPLYIFLLGVIFSLYPSTLPSISCALVIILMFLLKLECFKHPGLLLSFVTVCPSYSLDTLARVLMNSPLLSQSHPPVTECRPAAPSGIFPSIDVC